MEEQARICDTTFGFIPGAVNGPAFFHGTASHEQLLRWMPDIASGRKMLSVCITEPDAGTDVKAMRSTARREGDEYVLNGNKIFIMHGQQAELSLVAARTRRQRIGREGHLALHGRDRQDAWLQDQQSAREGRPERPRHLRDLSRRRTCAGREPDRRRRGQGLRSADGCVRPRATVDRRRGYHVRRARNRADRRACARTARCSARRCGTSRTRSSPWPNA